MSIPLVDKKKLINLECNNDKLGMMHSEYFSQKYHVLRFFKSRT